MSTKTKKTILNLIILGSVIVALTSGFKFH
ncbi:hypothetical protein J2Z26_003178 [Bacillus luteolus]|nr:hypothetical protein [Cytobacillus luteolus]